MTLALSADNRPIAIASGFILVILALGTVYPLAIQGNASFLSPTYLLQQLQVGSFLGVVAAGMMLVILMGHIDLSVPWTVAASAMLATAIGGPEAVPVGPAIGAPGRLFSGLGGAFLPGPSLVFTPGVNTVLRGLMVMLTGGFSPTTMATPPMQFLAKTEVLRIPMAVFVWALLSLGIVFLLTRTPMGRYIYAIGNRESAAYLSGVNTRLVILGAFTLCGLCSALAGILLAGYSSKAYQAMGDPYLLPAIAAVVIGGTNILGGQGRLSGTVVGTILIVLLQSVLSIMQMPEAGRQIIYGLVIIGMLLIYGRGARLRA